MSLQIASFEPDLLAFFEIDWDEAFLGHVEGSLSFVTSFSNLSESSCDVRGLCFLIG